MYQISELAEQAGLSRTTLLYYEKLELIKGRRLNNGYRIYNEIDLQRLRLIQQLHDGGLTLKECKACLEAKIDRQVLLNRLSRLDTEIAEKQNARRLLSALLGEEGHKEWHESIDRVAPDAHLEWLMKQGLDEKEALRLKWLSKDMNEHEQYMADFFYVFETLERWGPGLDTETLKALSKIPFSPQNILEVGCGQGLATLVLAQHSAAKITAIDNHAPALEHLSDRARAARLDGNITTVAASMTDLPFEKESFDIIWSEGSAYIMGVSSALNEWREILKKGGVLVMSDLVWFTHSPTEENLAFWNKEYPDMNSVAERTKQAEASGYQVLDCFPLSPEAGQAYYAPLEARVTEIKEELAESVALKDIQEELRIYRNYSDEFGYQMFILQKI